jgi:hypothetical protein
MINIRLIRIIGAFLFVSESPSSVRSKSRVPFICVAGREPVYRYALIHRRNDD